MNVKEAENSYHKSGVSSDRLRILRRIILVEKWCDLSGCDAKCEL